MPEAKSSFDVIVIGGGPAGMSAALWCADLGLKSLLIDKDELGGQLHNIHNPIENYLGITTKNGREMLNHFETSLSAASFERLLGTGVKSINADRMAVMTFGGEWISANAIIVATGVRRRRLGVPGEKEFEGRGILDSGSRDRELTRGKRVVIVGGGDAAIENALILSEYAKSVTVVHRREQFAARNGFMKSVYGCSNLSLITDVAVVSFSGSDRLEKIEIRDNTTGESRTLLAGYAVVRIGVEPNSEIIPESLERDAAGYLKVDLNGRTNLPGIFAIGDVANPGSPTISSAAGMGAAAAKTLAGLTGVLSR